jgi:hypothetical protein
LEQEIPTNDEIDDRLKQLAIAAKNHQSRTLERQQAMIKLITEIEKYKIINSPQTTNFSSETYQGFCAEAQHNLMLGICRKIHNYRPEKKVFTVNVLRLTYAADEDF